MLELSKGTQLANRYSLIRPLGGGGEAAVWLAKDKLTAADVALKIIKTEDAAVARLRREWQTNIRLMHPHIARAFEFHTDDTYAFFSQQFIDGPNLRALAGTSLENILGPLGLIADAVAYIHGKGLVHRDLKAENILLDANGAPYIIDFGVASAAGAASAGGSLIVQSPQSLGGQPSSVADDSFAFGGMLYELIAQHSPYSQQRIAEDIRDTTPVHLVAASGEDIPDAIRTLVANLLAKDSASRPDAESIVAALRDAGFRSGTATITKLSAVAVTNESANEVVAQRYDARPVPRPSVVDSVSGGVGRKTAIMSLGVLLLLLIAVVFYLPERVQSQKQLQKDIADAETAERDVSQDQNSNGTQVLAGDDAITFSENAADFGDSGDGEFSRSDAETAVGELLAALQVLESRGVDRWAPIEYRKARDLYSRGDTAYLKQDFRQAKESYSAALAELEPLYDRIEPEFRKALAAAEAAFAAGDRLEALRFYELAVAITPTHARARAGYERARNLERVLQLVDQGIALEEDLDLGAAERSFTQALEIDPVWQPAADGLQRVQTARVKLEFDLRMSEGFVAIGSGDYLGARAAFRVAQKLLPSSTEPSDGLLQVEQALRLGDIQTLEREAVALVADEHWEGAIKTFEEILQVDATLAFANDGLSNARAMASLHQQLEALIEEPDNLSTPRTLQQATQLVVSITTRSDVGPRLAAERDELSRLLKRAVTPLTVPIVSDNMTQVSIYKVGRLGSFMRTEVTLRPGNYVAVGMRSGYRDVREEFRVAPEVEIEPVVVRCEEPI